MKAVAYQDPGKIDRPDALIDIELPRPVAAGRDVLVEIRAIAVNPADTKVRANSRPADGNYRTLGWDASGVVVETGSDVVNLKVGDEVYFAGDIRRPGSYAEYTLVDERIVGRKPTSLGWADAAALPLTSITAWEALFDRLDVNRPVPGSNTILIIGGAGGVGSIATQLARQLTELTVVATASRPETREWAIELGAHRVIDHTESMREQLWDAGIEAPGFVLSTTHTDMHLTEIASLIAPQGRLALIDDPEVINIVPFKTKSVSVHWEFMFARSMFTTQDIDQQSALLNEVARLADEGKIKSTAGEHFGLISADNLKRAHALIESNKARGKLVLEGFES